LASHPLPPLLLLLEPLSLSTFEDGGYYLSLMLHSLLFEFEELS